MEKVNGIEIRECADLGPVIARADHRDHAIEVNRQVFYQLPSLVQEFVLCHEVCHLQADEYNEAVTNHLAAQLFLSRATNEADCSRRAEFLAYLDGKEGDYTNFSVAAITAIIGAVATVGTTVYGIVKQRNAGWYSWDNATQQSNLRVMLANAFEESRKSSTKSAKDFFWEEMQQYDNKDNGYDKFISRSGNAWVKDYVAQFEQKYGFKFDEVTPVDLLAFTGVKVALGVLVGLAAFMIIKHIIKNRK